MSYELVQGLLGLGQQNKQIQIKWWRAMKDTAMDVLAMTNH